MTWLIRILMILLIGLSLYACGSGLRDWRVNTSTSNALADAEAFFGPLPVARVQAYQKLHNGPYGCTYVLLKLKNSAPTDPPKLTVSRWGPWQSLEDDGTWRKTPAKFPEDVLSAEYCLTGDPDKMDGVGIDGFADEILQILQGEEAWVSYFGGGEGQYMALYSAKHRMALRLRWGD